MATVEITSEVIGTVWKIEKSVGEPVREGELIMILESMKMEIPVEATATGTVAALEVAEGESVDEEQVLARIQT
jgi:biotin carboxyl carrier protein